MFCNPVYSFAAMGHWEFGEWGLPHLKTLITPEHFERFPANFYMSPIVKLPTSPDNFIKNLASDAFARCLYSEILKKSSKIFTFWRSYTLPLHRWGWNLAWRSRPLVHSFTPNFTPSVRYFDRVGQKNLTVAPSDLYGCCALCCWR